MDTQNKIRACGHIKLSTFCMWCMADKRQSVQQCDRCKKSISTDLVYLSMDELNPKLLCTLCHYDEGR